MTKHIAYRVAVLTIFVVAVIVVPTGGQASPINDLQAQRNALQDSIAKSNQQKQQQQTTLDHLKSEVANLNNQIANTQKTINGLNASITDATHTISDLTMKIGVQQSQLDDEKNKLQDAINHMYIASAQSNPTLILLQSDTISAAVSDLQSYQSLEIEIENKAKQIDTLKTELEKNRDDAAKQKSKLQSMQSDQINVKKALDGQVALKNALTISTVKTIAQIDDVVGQYKNQLKAVDGNIAQLLAVVQKRGKFTPSSGDLVITNDWTSRGIYYSQRSGYWANTPLSSYYSYLMSDSGCFVTALTMVANYYNVRLDPGQMLQKLQAGGAMYGPNLASSQVDNALDGRLSLNRVYSPDWGTANSMLDLGKPVIAHLGPEGHFVVISARAAGGTYIVNDPYYGASENSGYSAHDVDGFAFPSTD